MTRYGKSVRPTAVVIGAGEVGSAVAVALHRAARGARVAEGGTVLEVDPRGDPALCFGLDLRAAAIGREVVDALTERGLLPRDVLAATADCTGAAAVRV